jgi:hypothetical protein
MPMLELLRGKASERKLRLFAIACSRKIWRRLTDARLREAVKIAERFLQGEATDKEIEAARTEALEASSAAYESCDWSLWAASQPVFSAVAENPWEELMAKEDYEEDAEKVVKRRMTAAPLLRESVGNPFRLVTINPTWLTPTVTALATAAYEERNLPSGKLDTARLAVLADALEEAGCDNPEILTHLRSPSLHVRGCWAVDLLLAKE